MKVLGLYFSGSGNTRFCLEEFLKELNEDYNMVSIEGKNIKIEIENADEIIFAYPIYYSNMPKIVHDFIDNNAALWKDKQIFILTTMGLFSGDGSGSSARLFKKYGAKVRGGLHLLMPDSIIDVKLIKISDEEELALINKSKDKIKASVDKYKNGLPSQEGLSITSHFLGLFGQRLWFSKMTSTYKDKPKIDHKKCIECRTCINSCPMNNLYMENNKLLHFSKCTLCYRCVHLCPTSALTILGKKVVHKPSRFIR